jgi:hypothetical protein
MLLKLSLDLRLIEGQIVIVVLPFIKYESVTFLKLLIILVVLIEILSIPVKA